MIRPEPKLAVLETAGAAVFIKDIAVGAGYNDLAADAGKAALHLRGVEGLYRGDRQDTARIIAGEEKQHAVELLTTTIHNGGVLAPAAEAVLVELTDPETFWGEIREAKRLSKMAGVPDIPNDPADLVNGLYGTGPVSAVDLPRIK